MTLYNIVITIVQYALIVLVSWALFMVLLYCGLECIDYVITKFHNWNR